MVVKTWEEEQLLWYRERESREKGGEESDAVA